MIAAAERSRILDVFELRIYCFQYRAVRSAGEQLLGYFLYFFCLGFIIGLQSMFRKYSSGKTARKPLCLVFPRYHHYLYIYFEANVI